MFRPGLRDLCSRTSSKGDARLSWRGANVGLADAPGAELLLESATYVVVDLETTGLSPGSSSICEIGAVRVRGLELEERFETLVNPRRPLPAAIAALTGIDPRELGGAPPVELAVRRFLEFAGDAVLVAHNARFDIGFLDREVERLTGRRIAAQVVDTVWLARRVLAGRVQRVGLASLAHFFGTSTRPCHRALADAEATAEILLALIGLAQERGASTVAELADLAAPRARRLAGKRSLDRGSSTAARGLPLPRPQRAGALRRTRPRPPREAALLLQDRAAAAGRRGRARGARAGRVAGARLRARGSARGAAAPARAATAGELAQHPARSPRVPAPAGSRLVRHRYARARTGRSRAAARARLAARALDGWEGEPADALPALRAKLTRLSRDLRFEDAARLRDRMAALADVAATLAELERLRALELCLLVPAVEEGFQRAFFVSGGRVAAARTLLAGPRAASRPRPVSPPPPVRRRRALAADMDELLLIGSFLRRPPPELRIVPLANLRRAA